MKKLKTYWNEYPLTFGIQLLGFLFFSTFSFLALFFYQERTMSFDSANFAFSLVQSKDFVIPLGRWGCGFSQIIPLLALKMGCSLATFLKIYSVGFIFLYYLGFLIISTLLKNKRIAIVYLLTLCLTYRNTFYFSISEFSQGLALVVVLYAMVEYILKKNAKRKTLVFILSFVLIFSLYFFHQLLVLAIIFVLLVAYFKHKAFKNLQLFMLFAFTLVWFGFKLLFIPKESYEGKKIPGVDVFMEQIPNLFTLPSAEYFLHHLQQELIIPFLLGFVCLGVMLYQKRYFLFALFLGYPFVYLLLILITYYKGESPNMYEQYYIYFGLFIAVLLDSVRLKQLTIKYILILIVPLLAFSSYRIYASHTLPTKRLTYIKSLAKAGLQYDNRKHIIHFDDFPWGYAWNQLTLPVEMLLISSIETPKDAVTCYVPKNKEEVINLSSNGGKLLAPGWLGGLMNANNLDSNYFIIPISSKYLLTKRLKRDVKYYKQLIKYDINWMKSIREKAKKKGVSINKMIELDAKYLVNNK